MYDLIGDIHGHADELVKLLSHLGYQNSDSGYRHASRKVIFLGDFIDRGEHLRQHKQLLEIVMTMVKNQHALAVMGNHEFNALAYHTLHNGRYLRKHSVKNTLQHQAFLNEFGNDDKAKERALTFFYSLPLWLELDGLRVVHACWDQRHIDTMQTICPTGKLDLAKLIEASTYGSQVHGAVEILLKGVEHTLEDGITFVDKEGTVRNVVRVQWWKKTATRLGQMVLPDGLNIGRAASRPVPDHFPVYADNQLPCFIGHYWFKGDPAPVSSNVACLDYSVAKDGKLVAYRWHGEQVLSAENFTYVGKKILSQPEVSQ